MAVIHLPPRLLRNEPPVAELISSRITYTQFIAAVAVGTGLLLILTGHAVVPFSPIFGVMPGWPWLYGAVMAVGGAVILLSIERSWHMASLVAAISVALTYFILVYGFVHLWLSGGITYPPYPVMPYAGLAGLHLLHADVERRVWDRDRRTRLRQ